MVKRNPFDYVKAITETKEDLMEHKSGEAGYNAYLTVKALSKFQDCLFYANEMNTRYHLSNKLQFDFFINICRQKKRWSKWTKKKVSDDLEFVSEYYGYSLEKAEQALRILTDEDIENLRKKRRKGGT